MTDERTYSMNGIIRICENRGWNGEQISQFLYTHGNMINGYTEHMVDAFEFSVNGPVINYLHPDIGRKI